MSMSWLIVMFILNGVPAIPDAFPPMLVPASECMERQQKIGQLMALAFPNSTGMAFCLPAINRTENHDVPA